MKSAAVVGGGVFGVTAALALARRGFRVILVDEGPIPHPLAESTDISKVVRADYGSDEIYTEMAERALAGWRDWNRKWGEPLYHETGVTFLTRSPMAQGGFEHESYQLLSRRGHRLQRLQGSEIRKRFPAWGPKWTDGYYNPEGGFAESGRVVARLAAEARAAGVDVQLRRCASLDELAADRVVVTAGSWTTDLIPTLKPSLRQIGQPVFHLQPTEKDLFDAKQFPVFGADIAQTGYYGFPINGDGIVKIANHGVGTPIHPDSDDRRVTQDQTDSLRSFLSESFPALANAPLASTRVCVYCDTKDEHFWIARSPEDPRVTVAAGGSGHAFKFAPLLGDLIADAVEDEPNPLLERFRWRPEVASKGEEAARHRDD